jgi:hypothetical protein
MWRLTVWGWGSAKAGRGEGKERWEDWSTLTCVYGDSIMKPTKHCLKEGVGI